jgi:hypothetical protein
MLSNGSAVSSRTLNYSSRHLLHEHPWLYITPQTTGSNPLQSGQFTSRSLILTPPPSRPSLTGIYSAFV